MVAKKKTVKKNRKIKGKWDSYETKKPNKHINVRGSRYTTLPDGQKTALDAPMPYGIKPIKRKKK